MSNSLISSESVQATRVAVPYTVSITNMQEAMKFAELVAQSSFVPREMRGKPGDCLLAMQFGAELGLRPMQALQNISVINGRPSIWGDAALALVKASPDFQSIDEVLEGEGESMKAVCTVIRRGEQPQTRRFSVADAKLAKLWGKTTTWTQYPARMLQMRARGFALRDVFPHVLKGLILAEEAQDYPKDNSNNSNNSIPAQKSVLNPAQEAERAEDEWATGWEADDEQIGTNTTHHKSLEAAINGVGLSAHRERIKAYCKNKYGVEHFPDLKIRQANELKNKLSAFAAKIQEEEQEKEEKEQEEQKEDINKEIESLRKRAQELRACAEFADYADARRADIAEAERIEERIANLSS